MEEVCQIWRKCPRLCVGHRGRQELAHFSLIVIFAAASRNTHKHSHTNTRLLGISYLAPLLKIKLLLTTVVCFLINIHATFMCYILLNLVWSFFVVIQILWVRKHPSLIEFKFLGLSSGVNHGEDSVALAKSSLPALFLRFILQKKTKSFLYTHRRLTKVDFFRCQEQCVKDLNKK
jgi:hypothetical protein